MVEEGDFVLTEQETLYRGAFPIDASALAAGSTVQYRVTARDAAQASNETAAPGPDAFYTFNVVRSGVLRSYTFETLGAPLQASGAWERGTPTYGLTFAQSGENVWATRLDDAYPDQTSRSTLTLPSLNLEGLGPVYLIFWHWYDIEHNGNVVPDRVVADSRIGLLHGRKRPGDPPDGALSASPLRSAT